MIVMIVFHQRETIMSVHHASAEIGQVAKSLVAAKGKTSDARIFAVSSGFAPRVERILSGTSFKSAVGAGTLTDGDFGEGLADWQGASAAFFGSMRTDSVFFRLLDSGLRRVPLRTHVGVVSTAATAFIKREGAAIPVNRFALSTGDLAPSFAAIILVMTDDLASHISAAATNLINAEMRAALATAVDTEFFDLIIDTSTPSRTSEGIGVESFRRDLRVLLEEVNLRGTGPLIWAMAPDVANEASILDERGAMTPIGGELLGLPAMVSSAIPAGTLRLLNGAAIGGNAEPIVLDSSNQTSLEMADDPANDASVPTAAQMVSMWQTHSTALLAKVFFAARRMRVDAIAEVTGIGWLGTT
ncbi:MAG: phage major capsid protein [Rhizobiaceae bacterium]|nr:phage major capsid protein [Rhizobiaceae bacterium]